MKGKKGSDAMSGRAGIDVIRAKDHTRDVKINCGPGAGERAKFDKGTDPKPKSC